ncbi:MAG TPA: hypothetical protein PLB21_02965 [Actinomycetota bacterium]|nr:hypothetical protein [Actinomycetota bacterium]
MTSTRGASPAVEALLPVPPAFVPELDSAPQLAITPVLVSKIAAAAGARRDRTLTEVNVPRTAVPSFVQPSNTIAAVSSAAGAGTTGKSRLFCDPFRAP